MTLPDHPQRFRTGERRFRTCSERVQRRPGCFQQHFIIINDEHINGAQLHLVQLALRDGELQFDGETGAFVRNALALDRPVHHVHHFFRDGQSETRALDCVDAAVCLPDEGFVHLFHEFRRHPDPCILDPVGQRDIPWGLGWCLCHVNDDRAPRRGVFDGVGEDVDEDLVQPELVRVEIFIFEGVDVEAEIDILFFHHGL